MGQPFRLDKKHIVKALYKTYFFILTEEQPGIIHNIYHFQILIISKPMLHISLDDKYIASSKAVHLLLHKMLS